MRDRNTDIIKSRVHSVLPESQIVLFGSRARKDYTQDSDYDILVIVAYELDMKQKIRLSTMITKMLINEDVQADVLIESHQEIDVKKRLIGNIIGEAVKEGIVL